MDFSSTKIIKKTCPIRQLGTGAAHHFFGYYNKTPWHQTQPYVLANQYGSMDADLTPDQVAAVGYFDVSDNDSFHKIGETSTWNWQMGCQLQWLDGATGNKVIFNVRAASSDGHYPSFGALIHDIDTNETTSLAHPVYSVAPDSSYAITVDYRRLYVTHETIGYSEDRGRATDLPLCPADDGLRRIDLPTGETRLLVSYDQLKSFHHRASMDKAIHWISHAEINPSSSRILFLHRWTERVEDETCFLHRLITVNADGSGMRLLECSDHPLPQLQENFDPNAVGTYDYEKSEYQISHPFWKDDDHIIVWGPHADAIHYHLYQDKDGGSVDIVGQGLLTENGHMSYSPTNQRWLLTDTYPDSQTSIRKLLIYDTEKDVAYDIGDFYTSDLKKVSRCDLHPRWNRTGSQVCIDSVHEGQRQMYVVDVSAIVGE
ncbi:hypothetical protein [Pollutimonas harenae]|uniref:Oligogalacturonate lyase domain-containing protein n=1 Tax=Pollutimonas harenae TaxID=657015 RepID=A0A853GRV5_9BURK|nr:hypothetical protein [Pollutimonas harenae]NYT84911.1 hypothetical protein [Pollutimonas harenae]TEA72693.1 hypothetical protein ERD84_01950 [Pollutimonas harenae]